MALQNIRLGSNLSFDTEQEKDLIMAMTQLNESHSMGRFVSSLVRIAWDNPEIIDKGSDKFEKGALLKQLESSGVSYNRAKFFNDISKQVAEMKEKVDAMYDMALKTYMLAQMGKRLGLEEKSDTTLMTAFLLESQLKKIQNDLGLNIGMKPFASDKLDDAHKRADDAMEYILETYDNILTELKNNLAVQTVEVPSQQIQLVSAPVQHSEPIYTEASQAVVNATTVVDKNPLQINNNTTQENKDTTAINEDDVVVDFGGADITGLMNFFGSEG